MKKFFVGIAALSFFIACDVSDGPAADCEAMATRMLACHGSVAPELIDACEAGDSDAIELASDLETAECPDAGKGDAIGELGRHAFALPCSSLVVQAAAITRVRNLGRSQPLSRSDADTLRRRFGSLVDRVTIYWNADLVNEWQVGFTRVQLGVDIAGQAFGSRIYMTAPYVPGDSQQMKHLSHEFAHAEQAANLGGLVAFSWDYCEAFYDSEFSYRENQLEVEARAIADQFTNP